MSSGVYFINNSVLVQVLGLRNAADDSYVNNATVAVSIKGADGNNLAGETWPVTLAYVAGSNGDYQGVISSAVSVAVGDIVTLYITATATGLDAEWREHREVKARYG